MSLFVTATGTEVGKTVVSALILRRFGAVRPLMYWKPMGTGAESDRDFSAIGQLAPDSPRHPELYLYDPPVSPHLAARWAGETIERDALRREHRRLEAEQPGRLVVEGIGGLLVPINDRGDLVADLVVDLDLPCLLVASSTLGTINHTLLSLEALRSREIEPVGVVLNGPPNEDNRQAIETFGRVPILGQVPQLESLEDPDLARAAADLDPDDRLAACFAAPEEA